MIFLFPLSLLLFFLFFLILIFLLFVIIPIQAVRIAFEKLGLSPAAAFFVLLASLIGSFINIPLAVKTNAGFVSAFSYFSGFLYEAPEQAQVIALNLGGALIPICLCFYLFRKAPALPTIFATIISTTICYKLAVVVPGVGVTLPAFIPPIVSVLLAFLFSRDNKIPVAYISGVLGVLIGADLLNLPNLGNFQGMMSIGGAGVYDGIFLVGIFSALLA
ncbi:MAG TPA: DUF1614 domain-containing protein [Candidatus Ratteibacteria bacterium]|jgi:uncharacterized membrane protein|uniref:DUF1614 domain-containing protein n=1 Tax=candidate division TA06 bacterium ADurb.Bin131 TaxID=1852827 RepID=A0A1V6C4R4_UNCT6|nr:MAG: hypothetical protein BWX89_01579 [candidate division TA06 bacterium ADurb.Bin131]HOC02027.1 DUF1614 domain-containing protein [bacterium]HRS05824.1 DUF1614 domain-containing protein [Candidatus Ratteibacteria bacterium]HON05454.1 DUF1614 domain-containing protein [bacterium]HPC29982.1 DUF1614 domain-containing protein [bacterium]